MGLNMADGLQGMLKDGHKHFEGLDEAVAKNIEAVNALSAITRTSLGPTGMNKLVINHLEKITVTSDTATIVSELEIMHPAAKVLVLAAQMQEQEVGDGTNLCVTFGGEMLRMSTDLLRMGLHTSEVIEGYKKAAEKAFDILENQLCLHSLTDIKDEAQLTQCVSAVLAAKQYGYEDVLAPFVAKACLTVMGSKRPSINPESVRVCQIMGGSIHQSEVMRGIVVGRNVEGSVTEVHDAKIAVFSCGIETSGTEAKGTVLIKDASELMNYNKGEEQLMEDSIKAIAESGVKVIVAGGSISEMALHFIERYGMMILKIMSKFELRRVCRATRSVALVRLGPPTPEEIGSCESVIVKEIGGGKVILFNQAAESCSVATIILRASTQNVLQDLERAIDDGVNCVKSACSDPRFCPGAGASEIELARQLAVYADTCPGLEQYSIKKFAECFEAIPRAMAENSGKQVEEVISKLYAAHAAGNISVGLDIENDSGISDAMEAGIYDSYAVKESALRLAIDAALTVLSVDQIIMSKPAGGPKIPGQGGR